MQWRSSLRNGTKQIRILVTLLRGHIFLHMTFTKGIPHTAYSIWVASAALCRHTAFVKTHAKRCGAATRGSIAFCSLTPLVAVSNSP